MTKKNIFLNVLFSFCMIFLLSSCSKREGNVVNMYNWGEYIDCLLYTSPSPRD